MSGGSEGSGGGEKSHEPTQKRLDDARREGEVAKSDEVTVAAIYIGLMIGAATLGAEGLGRTAATLSGFFANADSLTGRILGPGGTRLSMAMMAEVVNGIAPLFLFPAAGALAALIAQRAITVTGKKLEFKANRLSPLASLKNKFGPTGLMEFAKKLVKLIIVSATVFGIIAYRLDEIVGAVSGAPAAVTGILFDLFLALLTGVIAIAVTVAFFDYAWVQFDFRRRNRMSLQDLRDETKESEGDPMLKAKRRRRATEIATNRMLADVPAADVVIVNPTHYAVALKWSRAPGSAPVCVAKGQDALAATIREIASAAGVPIHPDPPTARALHATVEIGAEIPEESFRAVAAAIRFAEEMRRRARERGVPGGGPRGSGDGNGDGGREP